MENGAKEKLRQNKPALKEVLKRSGITIEYRKAAEIERIKA